MTHLDYAILGLIYQKPSTGYEIRKVFDTTALGNYSSSPGSIYPVLKRLKNSELVVQENADSGRKLFVITRQGEMALKTWLTAPIESSDIAKKLDIILLRFAFMEDLVTQEDSIKFLESLKDQVATYLKGLKEFHRNGSKDMRLHGRLAFEHGIESYQTTLRWIQRTLRTMK